MRHIRRLTLLGALAGATLLATGCRPSTQGSEANSPGNDPRERAEGRVNNSQALSTFGTAGPDTGLRVRQDTGGAGTGGSSTAGGADAGTGMSQGGMSRGDGGTGTTGGMGADGGTRR